MADTRKAETESTDGTNNPQVLTALVVVAVIALVGVLGFVLVPREGQLFGVFGVNLPHNAVHLLTGLAGVAAGYYAAGRFSDEYNKYGGLAYLLLFALWFVIPGVLNSLLNINLADTLLHFGLGAILAAVGFGAADRLG